MLPTPAAERLREGEAALQNGDFRQGLSVFTELLRDHPESPAVLNNAGVAHAQLGQVAEAIACFERALVVDAADESAFYNALDVLLAAGSEQQAADLFGRHGGGIADGPEKARYGVLLGGDPARSAPADALSGDGAAPDIPLPGVDAGTREEGEPSYRVGFVSLWYERGQAYITRMLRDAAAERHETFVLARNGGTGGDARLETTGEWAVPNLTVNATYEIEEAVLRDWVEEHALDVVFFNEEYDFRLVRAARAAGAKVVGYYVWELFDPRWAQATRSLYDAVICPTAASYQHFRQLGIDNAVHLPWCSDESRFYPEARPAGAPVRFFHPAGWGGLHARRGTQFVLDAFERAGLSGAELLIHTQTGEGETRAGDVTLRRGTVPRDELAAWYRAADVVVLPSKWEGLGLTFLEAIGAGAPILTVDAPPMNEFVRHEASGLLCRVAQRGRYDGIHVEAVHADVEDLALQMRRAMDPALRVRLREGTLALRGRFSQAAFRAGVKALVDEVVRRADAGLRLNLGCGTDIRAGFVNIDQRENEGVDEIADVSSLPYEDGTVSEILANDILEHFPRAQTDEILAEWTRVLRPDGLLRVQCPDVRSLAEAMVSHQIPASEFARRIYGGQTYPGNFHYAGFDLPEMKRTLRRAGLWPEQVDQYNGNLAVVARRSPRATPERLRVTLISARFSNHPWGTGNFIHRALAGMGHEVLDIDFRRDADRAAELLREPADLVIAYKASGIPYKALERVACPLVLWYPDDIFSAPHALPDLRRSAPAYDHVYYFDAAGVDTLHRLGIRHARYLPLATDPEVYRHLPGVAKRHDVAFVGNVYPNRRALLDRLKQRFDVLETRAYMDDMVRVFNEARIVLNLGVGRTGFPLRVFEALGTRSLLVTNRVQDAGLFEDGRHLAFFDDDDVEEVIARYLADDAARESVAECGYREVLSKHTFEHRVARILEDVGLSAAAAPVASPQYRAAS